MCAILNRLVKVERNPAIKSVTVVNIAVFACLRGYATSLDTVTHFEFGVSYKKRRDNAVTSLQCSFSFLCIRISINYNGKGDDVDMRRRLYISCYNDIFL